MDFSFPQCRNLFWRIKFHDKWEHETSKFDRSRGGCCSYVFGFSPKIKLYKIARNSIPVQELTTVVEISYSVWMWKMRNSRKILSVKLGTRTYYSSRHPLSLSPSLQSPTSWVSCVENGRRFMDCSICYCPTIKFVGLSWPSTHQSLWGWEYLMSFWWNWFYLVWYEN